MPWKHGSAGSNPVILTKFFQEVSELVEAAGLGNQSRHKGSVVRGFEPHRPEVVEVKLPARGNYCTIERLTKNLTSSLW